MMWASLLLAGFLCGWWGALALAAAPPANRDTLAPPTSLNNAANNPYGLSPAAYYQSRNLHYGEILPVARYSPGQSQFPKSQDYGTQGDSFNVHLPKSSPYSGRSFEDASQRYPWNYFQAGGSSPFHDYVNYQVTPSSFHPGTEQDDLASDIEDAVAFDEETEGQIFEEEGKSAGENGDILEDGNQLVRARIEDAGLPRHSSSQLPMIYPPSANDSPADRPRMARSAKQRPKNRNRADSPREQRRRCRNKGTCRGQNWCPDVDVGNRAFLAPTVFEGKARSMSSVRKPGSTYAVTFEVKQVYKTQPGFQPLQKNDSVRLHFRDKTAPGKSTVCGYDGNGQQQQQQQQQERDSGVVRANIKRGKVYLVFVNRVGPRNFTILGEPVIRSKKNEQAVQAVVRPDYVREVTLSELRDSIARLRDRVKLVCRTRGSPPPRVHWLKDGIPLHPRRGLRIQHKRRRSKVVISSAKPEDSGKYECVAESTSGHRASLAAQLLVAPHDTRIPETTTAAWPRQEQPCPIAGDFCMNGGTCLFFETVGEPACRCAEGFTGLRCETKDVISTGSVYNRRRAPFSCKLGLSTSYYC